MPTVERCKRIMVVKKKVRRECCVQRGATDGYFWYVVYIPHEFLIGKEKKHALENEKRFLPLEVSGYRLSAKCLRRHGSCKEYIKH